MHNKVLHAVQKYGMLCAGDRVVIGLSGGADSVCLLHVLLKLQETVPLTLQAVHVNHGIRGAEAERDEQFCKALCAKWTVPLTVQHYDVPQICKTTGESAEECGRRLRYAAFSEFAGETAKIATAHNANDNAETVLLNLTRGTGLRGLCGIPPVRGNVIRPLLLCTRAEIEHYCAENGLDYVTDSTNLCADYRRNRIRREVIPILTELNPSVLTAVMRLTEGLRQDEAALQNAACAAAESCKTEQGYSAKALLMLPKSVCMRVLKNDLQTRCGEKIAAVHLETVYALLQSGGSADLPGKTTACVRHGILGFPKTSEIPVWEIPVSETDGFPLSVQTPAGTVQIQKYGKKDLQILHKELLANAVDCAKIKGTLVLRSRRGGDTFTDSKRKVTKTLKKWFNEQKISVEQRNAYPVFASADAVYWLGGFGTSARFLPDETTDEFLLLTWTLGGNTNG